MVVNLNPIQLTGTKGRCVSTDTWVKRDSEWPIVAAQDVAVSVDDENHPNDKTH